MMAMEHSTYQTEQSTKEPSMTGSIQGMEPLVCQMEQHIQEALKKVYTKEKEL